MNLKLRLEHLLKESGPAPDLPWLLALLLDRPDWRRFAFRFLRLKFTPLILERIRTLDAPLTERSRLFTAAISFINAGETYKTTGRSRTRLVDGAILRHASRFETVHVCEVGASDGVASLELFDRLGNLATITLTDRHPIFHRKLGWPLTLILNGNRQLLGIKLLGVYFNLSLDAYLAPNGLIEISTLNPLLAEEKGVPGIIPFDIRHDRLNEHVEIIKCANVFNRKYFPDQTIRDAVDNLGTSLVNGGLLFISQNNERYKGGESYFIMEKRDTVFRLIEERNDHEAAFLFRENA